MKAAEREMRLMRCLIRPGGSDVGPRARSHGVWGYWRRPRRAWSCSTDHENTADYPSSSHVGDKGDSAEGPGPSTQDPGPVVEDKGLILIQENPAAFKEQFPVRI